MWPAVSGFPVIWNQPFPAKGGVRIQFKAGRWWPPVRSDTDTKLSPRASRSVNCWLQVAMTPQPSHPLCPMRACFLFSVVGLCRFVIGLCPYSCIFFLFLLSLSCLFSIWAQQSTYIYMLRKLMSPEVSGLFSILCFPHPVYLLLSSHWLFLYDFKVPFFSISKFRAILEVWGL